MVELVETEEKGEKGEKRETWLLMFPASGMMGRAITGPAMDRRKEVGGVLGRGRVRPHSRESSIGSFGFLAFFRDIGDCIAARRNVMFTNVSLQLSRQMTNVEE